MLMGMVRPPGVLRDKLKVMEIIAWSGGIWIFLTQMVFGPFVRNFMVDKNKIAVISEEQFNKNHVPTEQ